MLAVFDRRGPAAQMEHPATQRNREVHKVLWPSAMQCLDDLYHL